MMAEKYHKSKYEQDFDFHEFFFKSLCSNGEEITEKDIEDAVDSLGLDRGFIFNAEKIISRTQGVDSTEGVTFY
jgi:hypothetical protein